MYTNADQLNEGKKTELKEIIRQSKALIIAVCEMKPKKPTNRTKEDYVIADFTLYDVNLLKNNGRGIAVYIHQSISHRVTEIDHATQFEEACVLEIQLEERNKLVFGCFYRSPTESERSMENLQSLTSLIKTLSGNKKYTHKCFVGDFNFKDIEWPSMSTHKDEESKELKFIEAIHDTFLYQHVRSPTRCRGTDQPSTIDLIFTDEDNQIGNLNHLPPLGKSDHCILSFEFICEFDEPKALPKYQYHKADYRSMVTDLEDSNWKHNFLANNTADVSGLWDMFKAMIHQLRDKYVPISSPEGPFWKQKGDVPLSMEVRNLIREKSRLHRAWIRSHNGENHRAAYTKVRNKVKEEIRKAKRKFEKDVAIKASISPKSFWSHVRSKLKSKEPVAPLYERPDEKLSIKHSDKEKANILQKQFSSVFTIEPEGELPRFETRTASSIPEVTISSEMVAKKIKALDKSKACGLDGIHPRQLRELVDCVSEPIAKILNRSLKDKMLPVDWKTAVITPIFKKGNKNVAANYRPISLTSIICKIMESFVKEVIIDHLTNKNLISSKQFGFINGRSTTSQLLIFVDKCADIIAGKGIADTIYFDFAKAFDTVPFRRLKKKLEGYGINGQIGDWVNDFLTDRTQLVRVNGDSSDPVSVLSGIPQGSVLGPILFVIFINDLPDVVNSTMYLFADDTKLMKEIQSPQDVVVLQNDVSEMDCWSKTWLIKFNLDKCHVLTFGKPKSSANIYRLGNHILQRVQMENDLGVSVDSNLSFENHMATKISKANQIVGLIRRSFAFLDADLFKRLYIAFVRPHLEYAHPVWSPHLKKYISNIERVQRRATKLIDGFKNLEYQERLLRLNLPTLAFRRLRGDMIEVFKHLHCYDKSTLNDRFMLRQRPSRVHDHQLVLRFPKDGPRGVEHNSFYIRSIKSWNNLPRNVPAAPSLSIFKERLDSAWNNHPLKFSTE